MKATLTLLTVLFVFLLSYVSIALTLYDEPIMRLGIGCVYSNVTYSPDGKYIAASTSMSALLIDANTCYAYIICLLSFILHLYLPVAAHDPCNRDISATRDARFQKHPFRAALHGI